MIKEVTSSEENRLKEEFRKEIKGGTLPVIIPEEELPSDVMPVYMNRAALEHLTRFAR